MATYFRWIVSLHGAPPPINPGVYDVNLASLRVSRRKSRTVNGQDDWFLELEIDKLQKRRRKPNADQR